MSKSRFMSRLFSAVDEKDEELTKQVSEDIEEAKKSGSVDNDEISYNHIGDGKVVATDKGTGEHTLIEQDSENPEIYDLTFLPDEELARFLHPVEGQDGNPKVLPEGSTAFNDDEKIECHANEVCPGCNKPSSECECEETTDKKFSVTTNNQAVLRIFSDQATVDYAAQIVTNTDSPVELETMRFEKDENDPDAVVVTDKGSGDKAKVVLDGDDMQVTELEQKNFRTFSKIEDNTMSVIRRQKVYSHAEQFDPIFVVAIDTVNQVIVNSPVYSEEAANELAAKLAQMGLEGISIIADPDEAREYAISLLENNGVANMEEQVGEEEAKEFSDCTLFMNRYYTDRTQFMNKLFSEAEDGIDASQKMIEDAISEGEQIETEEEIITPIDDTIAIVEDKDNGEFTKVELAGEDMNVEPVSEEEADKLTAHLSVEDSKPEEAKEFSQVEPKNRSFSQVEGTISLSKLFSDTLEATQSIEAVEDKAMEAVQAIQETAETAVQAIAEAKEAPVEGQEDDIKEAQYSEKTFSDKINSTATLKSW